MDANRKAEVLAIIFEHENRLSLKTFFELSIAKGWLLRSSDVEELLCSQELALVDGNLLIPNPQAYYASLNQSQVARRVTQPAHKRKRK